MDSKNKDKDYKGTTGETNCLILNLILGFNSLKKYFDSESHMLEGHDEQGNEIIKPINEK